MTTEDGYTINEVSQLLGVTRPAVERRLGKDLPLVHGSEPRRVVRAEAQAAHMAALEKARTRYEQLSQAHRQFSLGKVELADAALPHTEEASMSEVVEALRAELAGERNGRSLAEARINELVAALRRANRAVDALMLDPDANIDRPS